MFKKLGLSIAALVAAVGIAYAGGFWQGLPLVGDTSGTTCLSFANSGVCNQLRPVGPSALTGTEQIPADAGSANAPFTVLIPSSLFQTGAIQVVTTNASVVMANGISSLVSNQGAATIALINLPPNPMNNQIVTIANAGSGVLTITSIAVGTAGQSIVQGAAPASLAIQTNNAAAAASSQVAYQYQASNTTWYRIL